MEDQYPLSRALRCSMNAQKRCPLCEVLEQNARGPNFHVQRTNITGCLAPFAPALFRSPTRLRGHAKAKSGGIEVCRFVTELTPYNLDSTELSLAKMRKPYSLRHLPSLKSVVLLSKNQIYRQSLARHRATFPIRGFQEPALVTWIQ